MTKIQIIKKIKSQALKIVAACDDPIDLNHLEIEELEEILDSVTENRVRSEGVEIDCTR